jgi:hypothetical protein
VEGGKDGWVYQCRVLYVVDILDTAILQRISVHSAGVFKSAADNRLNPIGQPASLRSILSRNKLNGIEL